MFNGPKPILMKMVHLFVIFWFFCTLCTVLSFSNQFSRQISKYRHSLSGQNGKENKINLFYLFCCSFCSFFHLISPLLTHYLCLRICSIIKFCTCFFSLTLIEV